MQSSLITAQNEWEYLPFKTPTHVWLVSNLQGKRFFTFMFGCTLGCGVFIWKQAALSYPQVYGGVQVFCLRSNYSFCLSSSACTLPCHFSVVLQLLAGRAAVKAFDFPGELHCCYAHTLRLPFPSHRPTMTLVLLVYF